MIFVAFDKLKNLVAELELVWIVVVMTPKGTFLLSTKLFMLRCLLISSNISKNNQKRKLQSWSWSTGWTTWRQTTERRIGWWKLGKEGKDNIWESLEGTTKASIRGWIQYQICNGPPSGPPWGESLRKGPGGNNSEHEDGLKDRRRSGVPQWMQPWYFLPW